MALLVEPHPLPVRAPRHRRRQPPSPRAVYLVPADGVLHFPGVPAGVAAPAQLGPLMSPPATGVPVYGR